MVDESWLYSISLFSYVQVLASSGRDKENIVITRETGNSGTSKINMKSLNLHEMEFSS